MNLNGLWNEDYKCFCIYEGSKKSYKKLWWDKFKD